jgi:hypothetical protein
MYRQFETFKNMPIKESEEDFIANLDVTNRVQVLEWSDGIIKEIESIKDDKDYGQIAIAKAVLSDPNASSGAKAKAKQQLVAKKATVTIQETANKLKEEELIVKKRNIGPKLSKEVTKIVGAIPQPPELKLDKLSDKAGKIITGIFTVLLIISFGLVLKDNELDIYTLGLLFLAVTLVCIAYCTLVRKCFLGTNEANYIQNILGKYCTLKIDLYINACLFGFSICALIMFKEIVMNIGGYFKNLF